MAPNTFFFGKCPICGRRLKIRARDLGGVVACSHCQGEFIASDVPGQSHWPFDPPPHMPQFSDECSEELTAPPLRPR